MEGQTNGGVGFGVASMVLGIVALVMSCCFYFISIPCAIIGIILAGIGLSGNKERRGMAIAGLVCSVVSLIPAAIVIISGVSFMSSPGV